MTMTTTSLECDIDTDLPRPVQRHAGLLLMAHWPLLMTYMNGPARAMLLRLNHLERGTARIGLPNAIMDFCLDLIDSLDDQYDLDLVSPVQLDRDISVAGLFLSLRGVGMPRSSELDRAHICVLMEEVASGWPRFSAD
jgi:hypothetical protein